MWNMDSTILAVWLEDVEDNTSEQDNFTVHSYGKRKKTNKQTTFANFKLQIGDLQMNSWYAPAKGWF